MYKIPTSSDQHTLMLDKSTKTFLPTLRQKSVTLVLVPFFSMASLAKAQDDNNNLEEPETASSIEAVEIENEVSSSDLQLELEEITGTEKLDSSKASIRTRPDARTMTLSIPAPRGQITDRFGYPYAQNTVVWYPALLMKQFEDESDEFVLSWSRARLAQIDEVLGTEIEISDEKILEHYKHRRWLPMPFKKVVRNWDREEIEGKFMEGLILHPIYQRVYPEKESAAHIIGYTGSTRKNLEEGPINYGDPLFWEMTGRAGLEETFDDILTGKKGLLKLQYNSQGQEMNREAIPPEPGGTVVTTIDMDWQRRAEDVLSKYCKRGAFVVIDVETGDVLVLASRPSYDLNLRVPFMKQKDLDELLADPSKPLFARAFQGEYPPASAFKVVTALAALKTEAIGRQTKLECPAFIKLGNIKMFDWSRAHRGHLNVTEATTVSNNPFFIQAALACEARKPGAFMNIATQLGYGSRTGLPLQGERPGNILTEEYAQRTFNRSIKQGDIANASIGQGAMLATPLQVAQSMAGVANDGILPKLNLIKQLQNSRGVITVASKPADRYDTSVNKDLIKVIKTGMYRVVNAPNGTGKQAATSYSVISGKTGTAQWGPPSKEQRLAWFAGFFPLSKPKYAFAVLYEGSPHESISGGKKAGPMIPAFFNPLKSVAFDRHYVSKKALIIPDLDDEPEVIDTAKAPGKAILVDEIEVPEANIPDEEASIAAPKALIVEDLPSDPVPNPIEPQDPVQEPLQLEPEPDTNPASVDPNNGNVPPLRDLPDDVNVNPQPTPDPVPAPSRAIPVE